MSDLDISHGGAISVDTEALREVGVRLRGLTADVDGAAGSIGRARGILGSCPVSGYDGHALAAIRQAVDDLRATVADGATGVALMADVYELVELRAQRSALDISGSASSAAALDAEIDRLEASDPRLAGMADMLVADWAGERYDGLHGQYDLGGALAPLFAAGGLVGSVLGFGKVLPGMTLSGKADPVTVKPVATSAPIGPPSSLAEAFRRFPAAPGAQLKVERYAMPDGTNRYVAYVKGTQSALYGASNPWDMKSNKELYTGRTSASYQATLDALAAAGAEPGDRVDVYAHSQAGMIAAHLAMESEFDVEVQVTAGSPVEPTLRDDQLLIQLRHTDDLVSSLAGGGSPGGTGSPDSFTAERVGDPWDGPQDVLLDTHHVGSYIDTARMLDASGDPRLEAIRDSWRELTDAVEIESIEYVAERE